MTNVLMRKTDQGIWSGFTCSGHSGFARSGEDIVCAAVSALVINTINSLEKLLSEDMAIVTNESDGLIDCRFKSSLSDKGNLLMDSLVLGLTGIAEQYGSEYLIIKIEEV